MNILITGNLGYVGPVVVRHLRQLRPHARLVGCDLGLFAHSLTTTDVLPETLLDAQWYRDVRSLEAEDLRGFDAIVHLAAVSNDPMGNVFEAATMDINFAATERLAKLAASAGVRAFVFASSCSVYGVADADARTETSAVNPLTAYARSKVASEQALQRLASSQFSVTCLRFSTACGASDRLRLDLVLNDFVASAIGSKEIKILSDGTPWRPLIHTADMARAIGWALGRVGEPCVIVNVGRDDWNFTVKQLADAVAAELGDVRISVNPDAAPDKRSYRVDFALFRMLAPGHQPEWSLQQTVRDLKPVVARVPDLANFRTGSFLRLNLLKSLRERGLIDAELRWTR